MSIPVRSVSEIVRVDYAHALYVNGEVHSIQLYQTPESISSKSILVFDSIDDFREAVYNFELLLAQVYSCDEGFNWVLVKRSKPVKRLKAIIS